MQNYPVMNSDFNKASVKDEKTELFFTSLMVGACFLSIYFLSSIYGEIVGFVYSVIPELWEYDKGVVADSLMYIFYAVVCFVMPALAFTKMTNGKVYERVSFAPAKKGLAVPTFLLTLGLIPLANYISNIVVTFFNSFNLNPDDNVGDILPETVPGIIIYAIQIAVIPALCEEILCRGFVFGSLRKFGEHSAIIFSAVIFALFHKNFQQIPFALILGLVFAYSITICESIWIPVLAHFVNNLGACVLSFLPRYVSSTAYGIISGVYMLFLGFLGVLGIILVALKAASKKVQVPKYEGNLSAVKRNVIIYTSPTVVIFTVMMLIIAVLNML